MLVLWKHIAIHMRCVTYTTRLMVLQVLSLLQQMHLGELIKETPPITQCGVLTTTTQVQLEYSIVVQQQMLSLTLMLLVICLLVAVQIIWLLSLQRITKTKEHFLLTERRRLTLVHQEKTCIFLHLEEVMQIHLELLLRVRVLQELQRLFTVRLVPTLHQTH